MVKNVLFIGIFGDSGNFSGVILRLNWYALLSVSNKLVTKKEARKHEASGHLLFFVCSFVILSCTDSDNSAYTSAERSGKR